MNLDRIAIDVEALLAAKSIIGSAWVTQSTLHTTFVIGFDRTDGVSMRTTLDKCDVRPDFLADLAALRLIEQFRAWDDPNAVHAPEAPTT